MLAVPASSRGASQQPSAVPSIVYTVPVCSGTIPFGRWSAASAVVGSCMWVYGGVGPSILDDLACLDVESLIWKQLPTTAARSKDRPDKLHAAAMCAVGSTLWMFGGQQGRKHLRTLYSLNTDVLAWKLVTPAGAQPAAREGHTLTTVASSGLVYLFGGQGKKFYNDMFILKPGGAEWVELKAAGRVPSARSGHSMVWDGGDRLICFAGAAATTSDNALSVYSVSANEWTAVRAQGTAPTPRARHTAVLLGPNSMLVFGGCNSSGVFYNDAYLLALDTWTWTRLQPLNPPPQPRYHHCCHVVAGKVVLYGGVNPKQAFDSVVLLQTSCRVTELSALADELARMTGSSPIQPASAGSSAAAAVLSAPAAGPAGSSPLVGDLMKLQLRDLLVKRNMEELHISAQQKAEAVEAKLSQEQAEKLALQKEVMQLKLVKEEAEASAKQLREQLTDANRALARETAEHQATSAVLTDLRAYLEGREQQLGDARQLLDSMSAELGILASRLHRLQQERDALRAAQHQERQARRQALEQQRQQQQQQPASLQPAAQSPQRQRTFLTPCQLEALQPLSGAAAAAAQLQLANQATSSAAAAAAGPGDPYTTDGSTVDSQSFVDCILELLQPLQLQQQSQQQLDQVVPMGLLPRYSSVPAAGSHSSGSNSSPVALETGTCLTLDQPEHSTDESIPMCPHGNLDGACLLCMCSRFLEATAGSCSHWVPASSLSAAAHLSNSGSNLPDAAAAGEAGPSSSRDPQLPRPAGPSAAGLATAAVAACASEAAQYRQYLSISELARNRLEAEHANLQQQVQDLQRQVQQKQHELQVLQAHPAALTACSIEELTALEGTLETSTKAVRQVVLQRSIAEYQRQASAETLRCAVCMEAKRSLAFGCGHQTCDNCGDKMTACPFCRQSITAKIRLFE